MVEPKLPVDRVRQPIHHFSKTQKYEKLLQCAKDNEGLILQCYGVGGSGKSEIVRKLAEQFPYLPKKPSLYVKWHIQCKDSGHDVKVELKKLVDALYARYLVPPDLECSVPETLKHIDDDLTGSLFRVLLSTKVPILIIIEDVTISSERLLKDFFRSLERARKDGEVSNIFHVYMTTRRKNVILSDEERSIMPDFYTEGIKGFELNEGVNFLFNGVLPNSEDEQNSAEKVCAMFSGSPLALRAAKTCCKDTRIDYTNYLRWYNRCYSEGKVEYDKTLMEKYGNKVFSIFQAITMPFYENCSADVHVELTWKVLSMLTYFHYDRIPLILVERCCQEARDANAFDVKLCNKIDAGKIITKLLDHEMCTETDDHDLTFHEVVMRAFRYDQTKKSSSERSLLLKVAIHAIAGLITKDMRERENSVNMEKLLRHTETLLKHAESHKVELMKIDGEVIPLLISHIYDTFGTIVAAKSQSLRPLCNHYFEQALKVLWQNDNCYTLTGPDRNGSDFRKIAKYVVKKCKLAGDQIKPNFIGIFESKLWFSLDKSIIEKFEKAMERTYQKDDMSAAEFLDCRPSYEVVTALRDCSLFLPEQIHQSLFFADRIAALLYSWSRTILYVDNATAQEYNRYIWYATLAQAIAVECRKKYNVSLLTERMSLTGGLIPIFLKMKPGIDVLLNAKVECEHVLNVKTREDFMYEHGLLKEVDGPSNSFIKIQMYRNMVRIYTRLVGTDKGKEFIKEGNIHCENLIKVANQYSNFANAPMCIVYCAKYYAASADYKKSFECFDDYFEKIKVYHQTKAVHSWAMYNYGRAVLAGQLLKQKDHAIEEFKNALFKGQAIAEDLTKKMSEVLNALQGMSE